MKFFGKECKIRKNGEHGIRVVLDSAIAEDFFSQFGKGAPNKKMPDWIFFAEQEKQLELVKGEWQGDGCRVKQARQKYLNITTTSKTLAFQLQSVYARLGIVATIDTEHSPNRLRSYHVNVFGRWAIKLANMWNVKFDYHPTKHADKFHIDDNYVYLPIRKIEVEQVENHRVMDVTVKDDHTFAPLGLATSNCVDACPFDALSMTQRLRALRVRQGEPEVHARPADAPAAGVRERQGQVRPQERHRDPWLMRPTPPSSPSPIVSVGGAIAALEAKEIIYGAVGLAASFFGVASLFFLLDSPFVAVFQITVYVGAVAVLVLFTVMLVREGRWFGDSVGTLPASPAS